jgi:hypothetical protein
MRATDEKIDRMNDQANASDPEGSYNILIDAVPATEEDWPTGKGVYCWCPVIQTRLVPNYTVIFAPSPDNLRNYDLVEYHGGVRNGDVTQHTIRRRASGSDIPATAHEEAFPSRRPASAGLPAPVCPSRRIRHHRRPHPITCGARDDLAWMHALRTYRQVPVAHGSSIPWEAVLLSPAVVGGRCSLR